MSICPGRSERGRIRRCISGLAAMVVLLASSVMTMALTSTNAPIALTTDSTSVCPSSPDTGALFGTITAPGDPGGFLRDSYGRDVIMHGVNAVAKTAPFEFTASAGERNSLTCTDAAEMAGLGFDIVRLGIIWKGLEPGSSGANDPGICTEGLVSGNGTANDPHGSDNQYDQTTLEDYLAGVKQTVDILASYGIYSLVDMHQDVYNEEFAGEGAPDWAVCTNGLPATNTGDWSANYFEPAVGIAYDHFWDNDVVGGLQQNYDDVWHQVSSTLADDPGVIGYDVFNEPFSTELWTAGGGAAFDAKLECFYTGTESPGKQSETHAPLECPPTDPAIGAIGSIESGDPNHLVFYEPDVTNDFGNFNWIGPMPYPNLVLGFHDYCLASAGQAYYDFYNSPFCSEPEQAVMEQESYARASAATSYQPGGPAWFMSEFGAGEDVPDLTRVMDLANTNLIGWTYWQWKLYDDPTGGSTEALVATNPAGQDVIDPVKAAIVVQPYAQAVAGTPTSMSYNPTTHVYTLTYTPDHSVTAPTVVFVPATPVGTADSLYDVYPSGYCVSAPGVTVTGRGTDQLLLSDPTSSSVTLSIDPGSCAAGG